ncbi:bifunctional 4-hydroxy-2-oxoglutarate aldolase/2-dehydro-3-deoxy-phosphogluconate aldolase [Thermanaerosceptrum fracticalcis]|uniref:Bifunctional 4-hydroxy-2-oxoglutarate aldolase/2-dehydro-3-deoxy-phosphogluconate aldolase n=1 Tax=Thermanaerosceptrum fracticalcis TaxID=1712410 RepID=A0A7G6DZU2_THEFR|nr:bifunctional 2-keto-4-hydroxyglutarate aldolase/2-keto-3-deoxy-6-phosphogluconate aldolase [Thermanaerosceptrum fracticalcis]QNB45346.1 bifunctional 4-hydroxy-2-oxoglutarate aldolase/2-dehydro-3-deoxy-phosphogluconate aldolase [Thermanaerosceptrum fracticalcis]
MLPNRIKILQKLIECGVVAVVRAESAQQAKVIADAVKAGGVTAVEITMTVPGALDVMKELAAYYSPEEMLLGAGTVLDAETARMAILAGAQYVVSPHLNLEVVKLCNRYQVPVMPGAMTIKEVVEAMEAGADVVKIFPGEVLGVGVIKAIKGPLPQAPLMPTGGVSLDNVDQWIQAGCVAVGVGSALTKGAAKGDYAEVTETARAFVEKVKLARSKK